MEDKSAKAIIREGIAEEIGAEKPIEKVQVVAKDEPKNAIKEKPAVKKEKVEISKPSTDWTQKEIIDYGISIGLSSTDLENKSKEEMLILIAGGKTK